GVLYSLTEAGFRMQTPSWIFFLLAIILASQAGLPESNVQPGGDDDNATDNLESQVPWTNEAGAVMP
ncbi:MAG: hypothetical protein ACRD2G_05185, partial [Terriglobia bacterium]